MISVRTFSSEIKSISSSFMKSIYIINIFYHFIIFEPRIFEVWKGKISVPWELSPEVDPIGVFELWHHVILKDVGLDSVYKQSQPFG